MKVLLEFAPPCAFDILRGPTALRGPTKHIDTHTAKHYDDVQVSAKCCARVELVVVVDVVLFAQQCTATETVVRA